MKTTSHTVGDSRVEWDERLIIHDWPECGPGSLSIEALYQAFKARLAEEAQSDETKVQP